jgi:hypothetical protein
VNQNRFNTSLSGPDNRSVGVQGLGFKIQGLGFGVWGLGFWVLSFGFRI